MSYQHIAGSLFFYSKGETIGFYDACHGIRDAHTEF